MTLAGLMKKTKNHVICKKNFGLKIRENMCWGAHKFDFSLKPWFPSNQIDILTEK